MTRASHDPDVDPVPPRPVVSDELDNQEPDTKELELEPEPDVS